jgi:hypothetical protein
MSAELAVCGAVELDDFTGNAAEHRDAEICEASPERVHDDDVVGGAVSPLRKFKIEVEEARAPFDQQLVKVSVLGARRFSHTRRIVQGKPRKRIHKERPLAAVGHLT